MLALCKVGEICANVLVPTDERVVLVAAAQYGQPGGGQQPQDHSAAWAAYYAQQGGQGPQVTPHPSAPLPHHLRKCMPSEFAERLLLVGLLVADEMMRPVFRLC